MRSGHKAVGLLLVFCGLSLNPICLSWLFSNDGDITSSILLLGIVAVEILIVLFGVSVYRSKVEWRTNLGLTLLSLIFFLGMTVSVDRFYGAFLMPETSSLLFPSYSKAEHNTAEFDLAVQINNLGFRGPNTTIQKQKKRVVVIGDSFTFGWGVEWQQTWVHLLSKAYPELEFLNLGQGGNHPGDYTRISKQAVPMLKPDLVLICVLQGNDMHQLMRVIEHEESSSSKAKHVTGVESKAERYQRYLGIIYPNLTKRFTRAVSIQKQWMKDANELLSELNEEQQLKYESGISEKAKTWFEDGLLNPSLVYESVYHPNMFFEAADTGNPLYKKGVTRLHDHLMEVVEVCNQHKAKILVVDMPNRPYGFTETLKPLQELGYNVSGCDTIDASFALQTASNKLKLSLFQPAVHQYAKPVFYTYDGHWNAEGNRIFANELTKWLEQNSEWKNFLTSSNF